MKAKKPHSAISAKQEKKIIKENIYMTLTDLLLIAVSLSMDAFAVATCKGLSVKKIKFKHFIITGLYFGLFQALMPFIGYLAGCSFSRVISKFDYIVSFVLLALIGANMIKEALSDEEDDCNDDFGPKAMLPFALATSIDALAVGVTFAPCANFTGKATSNIFFYIALIGVTTFLLSAIGVKIGNIFGTKYKKKAEIAGGVVLILLGLKMFVSHFI